MALTPSFEETSPLKLGKRLAQVNKRREEPLESSLHGNKEWRTYPVALPPIDLPISSSSLTAPEILSLGKAVMYTFAPLRTRVCSSQRCSTISGPAVAFPLTLAIIKPMPLLPPVTNAHLPLTLNRLGAARLSILASPLIKFRSTTPSVLMYLLEFGKTH